MYLSHRGELNPVAGALTANLNEGIHETVTYARTKRFDRDRNNSSAINDVREKIREYSLQSTDGIINIANNVGLNKTPSLTYSNNDESNKGPKHISLRFGGNVADKLTAFKGKLIDNTHLVQNRVINSANSINDELMEKLHPIKDKVVESVYKVKSNIAVGTVQKIKDSIEVTQDTIKTKTSSVEDSPLEINSHIDINGEEGSNILLRNRRVPANSLKDYALEKIHGGKVFFGKTVHDGKEMYHAAVDKVINIGDIVVKGYTLAKSLTITFMDSASFICNLFNTLSPKEKERVKAVEPIVSIRFSFVRRVKKHLTGQHKFGIKSKATLVTLGR